LNSIDIIIVNYESTESLIRLLGSVHEVLGGRPATIRIQDNHSRDGVERVAHLFPQVILTTNQRNLGFARAANQAIRQPGAPYLFLLNPDVIVETGLFDSIVEFMDKNPDVGIVGPRILNSDGSLQGSARAFPSLLTSVFGRSSLLTRIWPDNRISRMSNLSAASDGKTPMRVDWISGACMAVRREAVDEVGCLDERFFLYWEDVDWCKRMRQMGWQVVYFPQATVMHQVGGSSGKRPMRCILDFHKSCYRFLSKHGHPSVRFAGPLVIALLAMRLVVSFLINRVGACSTGRASRRGTEGIKASRV